MFSVRKGLPEGTAGCCPLQERCPHCGDGGWGGGVVGAPSQGYWRGSPHLVELIRSGLGHFTCALGAYDKQTPGPGQETLIQKAGECVYLTLQGVPAGSQLGNPRIRDFQGTSWLR